MLSEQIKQILHKQTKPFLTSTFSRKTSTLKKRSKAISTINIQDHPSYSPSKQITNEQKLTGLQTQQHQKTQQGSSQNGNSVSCQTNLSLCYFDEPLPEIPPSDPIWLDIIPYEILQGSSVEQLFSENKEYIYYLLGQYLQDQMQEDCNKNQFNLPSQSKTSYDHEFKSKTQEKLQVNKYSEINKSQNFQFTQNQYNKEQTGYSPQINKNKSQKFQFEKTQQQFATLTTYQTNLSNFQQNHKYNRLSGPRLSTSTEFQHTTQTNYNQNFLWPQIIEQTQNKNNQSKLNPMSSNTIFFEKKTDSYFQYPLHPLPKATKVYHKQYSTIIRKDIQGPRIGDVTQMKNWRQSVLKKMNLLRRSSQD